MKIYLFRHGQTDVNKNNLICSASKEPLNETGRKQAKSIGVLLNNKGIEKIYSSCRERTVETANIVSEEISLNKKVEVFDGLQEIDVGVLENTSVDVFKKIIEDRKNAKCPGGESKEEARKRFCDAVLKICKNSKEQIIAIASHASVIRQCLVNFNFKDDSSVKNCEIIECDFNKDTDKFKIIRRINSEVC